MGVLTPPPGRSTLGDRRRTVLFLNDNWGYGSTSVAIAISEELEGSAVRGFVGAESAFSLASRASFDFVIEHDTMAEPAADVLVDAARSSDVVVSIQNPHGLQLAAEAGVPCVYVDTLLWMWARPPPVASASHYFVEWFPGVEARIEAWKPCLHEPELVGPIIRKVAPSDSSNRTNVLVNFGGLSSSMIPHDALVRYAEVMTECVAAAVRDRPGSVTVCAGDHVLNELRKSPLHLERRDVEYADLDHTAYLDRLRDSAALVSSAGLHALYEAFEVGVPCVLLPAQNLSQALAIPTYRRRGLPCLDWDDLCIELDELSPAAEREACMRIADCVANFELDGPARSRLVEHLRGTLAREELTCIREAQARFTVPFPERGASRIGQYVLDTLGS